MSHNKSIDSLGKVLVGPLVSEKATRSGERENSVVFWVNPKSSKDDIKQAIEAFFPEVKVESVTTSIMGRRQKKFGQIEGRSKRRKKAYIILAQGQSINLQDFSG